MEGSVEIMTSLDRTPVTGSSNGWILSQWDQKSSTRPSLYTLKKRNSMATSSSVDAMGNISKRSNEVESLSLDEDSESLLSCFQTERHKGFIYYGSHVDCLEEGITT